MGRDVEGVVRSQIDILMYSIKQHMISTQTARPDASTATHELALLFLEITLPKTSVIILPPQLSPKVELCLKPCGVVGMCIILIYNVYPYYHRSRGSFSMIIHSIHGTI